MTKRNRKPAPPIDWQARWEAVYGRHSSNRAFQWDSFEENASDMGLEQGTPEWYRELALEAEGEGWT